MTERHDTPEGWQVRQGFAVRAAVGVLVLLMLLLATGGYFYNRYLRPTAYRAPSTLPAPGLETAILPGVEDPHLAALPRKSEPDIAAAKQRIVAKGLAGWSRQP